MITLLLMFINCYLKMLGYECFIKDFDAFFAAVIIELITIDIVVALFITLRVSR